jgi:hypothetical protein
MPTPDDSQFLLSGEPPLPDSVTFKRYLDGYYATDACNAGAILRSLARHMDADPTLRFERLAQDPAARLMIYQVVLLMFGEQMDMNSTFSMDYQKCRAVYDYHQLAKEALND